MAEHPGVRRVLLAVLGLVLLAGCGVRQTMPGARPPAPPPTTNPTTGPEVECPAAGVGFSVTGTDAAMGIRVLTIEMVNCGSRPYAVDGYPAVRLFDEDHEPVDVAVAQGSGSIATVPEFDVPPVAVTLRPGEKVRAGLLWRNLVTDATVDATTAHYLEAAPARGTPWQEVPLVVPDELDGARTVDIDLGTTGRLGVSAWKRA
jgi:hypothetical protein